MSLGNVGPKLRFHKIAVPEAVHLYGRVMVSMTETVTRLILQERVTVMVLVMKTVT